MEPWHFSHGEPWSSSAAGSWSRASMEPWHFSHGESLFRAFRIKSRNPLQWSHGILAMERCRLRLREPWACSLQWSHGILAMESLGVHVPQQRRLDASMEPWHFSHGERSSTGPVPTGRPWLQWSHGILAMESSRSAQGTTTVRGFNGAMAF